MRHQAPGDGVADDVRFSEPGASWSAVLIGPAFALFGFIAEAVTGPTHPWLWIGAAIVLAATTALFVYARRTYAVVRLTVSDLTQGTESLSVSRVSRVFGSDEQAPRGARVLGGGTTHAAVPRGHAQVPLELDDGSVVVAWARDGEGLRSALSDVVGA